MTLSDVSMQNGQPVTVEVLGFQGSFTLNERLQEMGFYPGLCFQLVRRLPFGGPILVQLENSTFSMRRQEAQALLIEVRHD